MTRPGPASPVGRDWLRGAVLEMTGRGVVSGRVGPPAVLAAKAAGPTIPIVFVRFGFIASFNKPGGNITGIWMVLTALAEKRLQLMHDLLPKAELIGLLVNPASPVAEPQIREVQAAAHVPVSGLQS